MKEADTHVGTANTKRTLEKYAIYLVYHQQRKYNDVLFVINEELSETISQPKIPVNQ